MAIDEIYIGAFAAVAILGAILGITMFMIGGQFSNDGDTVRAEAVHPHGRTAASAESQVTPSSSELNPEQLLAVRYEQSAFEEIARCLDNGDDSLPPLCEDTLGLLIESCKDPVSRVSACDDPRLLMYANAA